MNGTSSDKVRWLAKEIAGTYASYHFTDWMQAVRDAVDNQGAQGTEYTNEEIADAETIAQRMTTKWKKDFDEL